MNMNPTPHACASHMMNGENVELCEPLARLKEEHGPLREQMNEFARLAREIGTDAEAADWQRPLAELRGKVQTFVNHLDPHSGLEEGVLFPLMARYIGRESGPIAVMEYEHDQAKANLGKFLAEAAESGDGPVSTELAGQLAAYAIAAHSILTDHFMKEENVLFPMAQNLLTDEDKAYLAEKMNNNA